MRNTADVTGGKPIAVLFLMTVLNKQNRIIIRFMKLALQTKFQRTQILSNVLILLYYCIVQTETERLSQAAQMVLEDYTHEICR
jgi:hypothetical protein